MITEVSDELRILLERMQQGLESEVNVGDFILVSNQTENMQDYLYFGRLVEYKRDTPFDKFAPKLGVSYSINIIVLPKVEVLRTGHDISFVKNFKCYRPNNDELFQIINLLGKTELNYLDKCLKP